MNHKILYIEGDNLLLMTDSLYTVYTRWQPCTDDFRAYLKTNIVVITCMEPHTFDSTLNNERMHSALRWVVATYILSTLFPDSDEGEAFCQGICQNMHWSLNTGIHMIGVQGSTVWRFEDVMECAAAEFGPAHTQRLSWVHDSLELSSEEMCDNLAWHEITRCSKAT